MDKKTSGKMWSYGIIVSIVLFMIMTLSFVFYISGKRVDLVYPDYYERTFTQNSTNRRTTLGNDIRFRPEIQTLTDSEEVLSIRFTEPDAVGIVEFFRPSNASLDFKKSFTLKGENEITFPLAQLASGEWRIKLDWIQSGDSLLYEQKIRL